MCVPSRLVPAVLGLLLGFLTLDAASAGGKHGCDRCGCAKNVKRVCRLVRTCEQVEIPQYACSKQEVFFPDKGAVCHQGFRCDTFYHLWKNCDCTLGCSCRTKCGCKTLYGAKATGCHAADCVRRRVAIHTPQVATLKWETLHLCEGCCKKRR